MEIASYEVAGFCPPNDFVPQGTVEWMDIFQRPFRSNYYWLMTSHFVAG